MRKKILIIPLVLSCLILLFSSWYISHALSELLLKNLNNHQEKTLENLSHTIDEYMSQYKNVVSLLAKNSLVTDAELYDKGQLRYRGVSPNDSIAIRRYFGEILNEFPNLAYIATLSLDEGKNIVHEPYEAQLRIKREDYLYGFTHRDWYKGALASKNTYVSEAYLSASIFQPVVAISSPVVEEDEMIGILIATVKIDELSKKISSLTYGETGITFILDKNFNIVAHPDYKIKNDNKVLPFEEVNLVESLEKKGNNSTGQFKIWNDKLNEDTIVHYYKNSITGWYIVTQVSTSEIYHEITIVYLGILGVVMGLLAVYIVLLYMDTCSIISRLKFLEKISKRVMNNNFKLSPNEEKLLLFDDNNDEISSLSKAHFQMIKNVSSSIDKLKESNERIAELAFMDELTGLPNRRSFHMALDETLKSDLSGVLILIDLDNFKLINDRLGHSIGDKILIESSLLLNRIDYENARVFRLGGDEFIIILKTSLEDDSVKNYLHKLYGEFSRDSIIENRTLSIQFSAGISKFPTDANDKLQLLRYADIAMYNAKNKGKNRFSYFDLKMEKEINYLDEVQLAIKDALKNGGFKLLYQPQVSLESGKVIGFEALIRFKNNRYYPGDFIPIAEKSKQIISIGRWVFEESIRQLREWDSLGIQVPMISVNFSAIQLEDAEFVNFVMRTIDYYKIAPNRIEFEVTENVFIKNLDVAKEVLEDLQNKDFKISIDDFGTGYSSLNYIINLPISKIKLDRSISNNFIKKGNRDTLNSLIDLAHSLKLEVVAEGIELEEDVKALQAIKCNIIQGYYFDKPLEAEDISSNNKKNYRIPSL